MQRSMRPSVLATIPKTDFQRLDIVKLNSGQILVITGVHPNRPANKYSGVLERGQGKEYVFGDKFRPVKIGTADEGHPALLNREPRKLDRLPPEMRELLALLPALCDAAEASAPAIVKRVRELTPNSLS
jgi:hypothetical protein